MKALCYFNTLTVNFLILCMKSSHYLLRITSISDAKIKSENLNFYGLIKKIARAVSLYDNKKEENAFEN